MTKMGEVGGIIRCYFSRRRIPIIEVSPMTWKSLTIGVKQKKKPAAERDRYLQLVATSYGRQFQTTDCADAFLMYEMVKSLIEKEPATATAKGIRTRLMEIAAT